jgi:hypothetical protein
MWCTHFVTSRQSDPGLRVLPWSILSEIFLLTKHSDWNVLPGAPFPPLHDVLRQVPGEAEEQGGSQQQPETAPHCKAPVPCSVRC